MQCVLSSDNHNKFASSVLFMPARACRHSRFLYEELSGQPAVYNKASRNASEIFMIGIKITPLPF